VQTHFTQRFVLAAVLMLAAAGCATTEGAGGAGGGAGEMNVTTSVHKFEYYPYLVKGYQSSFPRRTVLILMPTEDREFTGTGASNHAPLDGKPEIGVVIDQDGNVTQRLYSDPLGPVVQKGIAAAAQEAGMTSEVADYSDYSPNRTKDVDYVVATIIKRCWVSKRRNQDNRFGAMWMTSADFAITVIVFKPPFKIPFWQGAIQDTYNDPPVGSFGLGPEDQAGIYDDPGEVLSVALTRGIAGIYERQDFRTLVKQDEIRH